jgi:hypothetical protein
LFRSLTEIDPLPEVAAGDDPEVVAGALVVDVELLQAAPARSAAAAAVAVSPARADTEYNGVPRSFTQTRREGMCENRSA